MRPIQIMIDGFTSYGEPTVVNLEHVNLAVITGVNGSGKSSLVDSIVWALYGRGRVDNDIDAMVTAGKDKATVQFEFDLDGRLWRATRSRVRGKRTTALLETQDDHGAWVARSSGAVRDTDEAIRALLGMTVDTFLATVIIGQGDADRFCSADPAARKEVLGDVLGLARFHKWAEAARGQVSVSRTELQTVEAKADTVGQSLGTLPQVRAELSAAETEHDALQSELVAAEANVRSAEIEVAAVAADVEAVKRAEARLVETERLAGEAVEANTRRTVELQGRVQRLTTQVETTRAELAASETASTRAAQVRDRVSEMAEQVTEASRLLESLREEGLAAKETETAAKFAVTRTETEVAGLQGRIERLRAAGEDGTGECQFCSQPLTKEHAAQMLGELNDLLTEATGAVEQARREADKAEAHTAQIRDRYRETGEQVNALAATHSDLQSECVRLEAQAGLIPQIRERLVSLETDLAGDQAALDEVTAVTVTVDSDPHVVAAREEVTRLRGKVVDPDKASRALKEAATVRDQVRERVADKARVVGGLTERIRALEAAKVTQRELLVEAGALRQTLDDWTLTARAFGRDGIPSLMIAAAIPELENQANKVLADLAGDSLRIKLNTTRVTKAGTEKETLDIEVLSEEGSRPYDSYSGGERLRVDIALRLGLSQLLAHRSGTQIRMLVVDEGWGPLDSDGIPALTECLRQLQESGRFASVYTVSHIPSVAEGFPQQLVVERGPDGYSMVETLN